MCACRKINRNWIWFTTSPRGSSTASGDININIAGDDPHTAHATISDRMSLRPGNIVDTKKLREDERRLKFSSIFNTDPTKGGPPKIAFVKSGNKDDSEVQPTQAAINTSNSEKRGAGKFVRQIYRGQSRRITEVLDVYPARWTRRAIDVAVFSASNRIQGVA